MSDIDRKLSWVMMVLFLTGCVHTIQKAAPAELMDYPTEELVRFERISKDSDPEVSQELTRRIKRDIRRLIHSATNIEDFESIRPYQTETIASKIRKKYEYSYYSTLVPYGTFSDARRQWYVRSNPELSDEIKECILTSVSHRNHSLKFGMTEEQVEAAIGPPNDVNRSRGSWGTDEQWVYGGLIGETYFSPTYFYFSNGRLESMQD